jgi:hypothetical protein
LMPGSARTGFEIALKSRCEPPLALGSSKEVNVHFVMDSLKVPQL